MSHSSSASQSGFSFTGLMVLILLGGGMLGFFTLMASAQSPTVATPAPRHIHAHTHHHHGDDCCECEAPSCEKACCKTCKKEPCCCKRPKEPTFHGRVIGGHTTVDRRCHGSVTLQGPSSEVYATGVESVRNAQLLHEHAELGAREQQDRMNAAAERMYAPPKEVVRTVTKTVVLTVPAPPVSLIPRYTVLEPTVVLDAFGRRWSYRNYGWYLP